ncbi:hypothetical protein WS70_18960 [Burkholderia mayonis]|uniref:Uncharacterized protein n=1 Tax=Burkholderia mayonis TaxID=1385591 RepID=A0A1B4FJX1_9BURK|nr:hypothetical protein WS70_18960 [Burkholderia mayonis]KVE49221.1 hypothetical protein WS70_20340 [Burkholderia mayonis]
MRADGRHGRAIAACVMCVHHVPASPVDDVSGSQRRTRMPRRARMPRGRALTLLQRMPRYIARRDLLCEIAS